MLRRRPSSTTLLELTISDIRPHAEASQPGRAGEPDLSELAREIERLGRYVGRLRREIAVLKPGETCGEQLPATREDLRQVRDAMTEAVNRIMAAAESLLANASDAPELGERVMSIMEACSVQDIAGQRLERAILALDVLERRFQRFVRAVGIADAADAIDPDTILREARREILLVEGPQSARASIEQNAVDKLFD